MTPAILVRKARSFTLRNFRKLLAGPKGRPRPSDVPDVSAIVPFGYDLSGVTAPARGIAIVCHLFYDDLAPLMRGYMNNVPFPADVFITTDTEAKKKAIEREFADWSGGQVEVRIAPNRGRDIAPKFVTLRDIYARYELVLILQGKKTLTGTIGDAWRDTLAGTLAGTPDIVRSVVDLFNRHPDMGVVMCQHFEGVRDCLHWDGNFRFGQPLAKRMGIALTDQHVLDFPSGSMFWARGAALKPLIDADLTFDDFPPEKGQTIWTNQHAIERLILFVAEHAGFTWTKIAAPAFFSNPAEMEPVDTPADLDRIIAKTHLRLL